MGICFKLVTNSGHVGELRHTICWGFLKDKPSSAIRSHRRSLSEVSRGRYNRESRLYGHGDQLDRSGWVKHCEDDFNRRWGVSATDLSSGIKSIIVCGLEINEGVQEKAFDTVLREYPLLFSAIMYINKEAGEIALTTNTHYASLFNQLRLLSKFQFIHSSYKRDVAADIVQNPELSIFILDLYERGELHLTSNTVFRADKLTTEAAKEFIKRRTWLITKGQDIPKWTMVHRGHCGKSRQAAYAELAQPLSDRRYHTKGKYVIPKGRVEFIEQYSKGVTYEL